MNVALGNVGELSSADSFHRLRTPSTAAGGPPPSKREVLGFRWSKPAALPSIAYRGFAVAPYDPSRALPEPFIQPRVQGRNPARFNGGYGVPRGFKGEKSKSPPNPLGLAERVLRPQAVEGVRARKKPRREGFPLGGVSFMPLGISPADEHRRPRRTASLRWRSRPARRRRLHR